MKRLLFSMLLLLIGLSTNAQQKIQLRSTDKAECVKSDMTSLEASFSFSTIEAEDYESDRGTFSWISLPNTVIGGNEGDPQLPVVNELIAVPFGSQPRIEITSFSSTEYQLSAYGIKTLVPRQPSLRKSQRPEDVPFVYNESAYQKRGFRSEPMAVVDVVGTMRGIQLGKMTIEPVSYDPVSNTLRVFNDIEVTVHFDGTDAKATEDMLIETYSPYFDIVYKSLFNGKSVLDAYTEHPDLYTTPVKMLVVTTSQYANCNAFANWLTWKKQKGIDVDVQVVASSTSAADIRSLIQSRYNAKHPTFLVIIGDKDNITNYTTYTVTNLSYNPYISDNPYASVDNDVYHDMFMSRMSVSSTAELDNLVNKILTYEKYTMSNPAYLNETLLIAGWDEDWTVIAGKPTIQYANNNYFNSSHGITPHVFITTGEGQTSCYDYINNVGFINYTAHGDVPMWYDPQFTYSQVSTLTNTDKYFWAMGNCCLTANWGRNCFGEAMIRAANKGAFGYIGSVPESYWYEDLYFGVGAFSAQYSSSNNPTLSNTTVGAYDALFDDSGFNTLNAVPYIGNVAVTYAHAANYKSSVDDEYYWRGYQCLGDGSVMPYLKVPAANHVSHANRLPVGSTSFTVSADAGSYVSITINDEIIGVAAVGSTGTVDVPVVAQYVPGTAMIVVTRNQRQPYIGTIIVEGSTQYGITSIPAEHGTIIVPEQAYDHSTVTLVATPDEGYCLSSWTVTDANNQNIAVTDNQFIMPETNVTITATFVPGMRITLASVMNGNIGADPACALQGTTINLKAKPDTEYCFNCWVVYETGNVNNTVTVTGNTFTMPAFPVTVSAIFTIYQSNDVTVGTADGTSSFIPLYAYYKNSFTEQIYTNSEVGEAGTITAIAYQVSNDKSNTRNIDIYLKHTTKSAFDSKSDWVKMSTSDRVFSGNVTFNASGWTTIPLDTPFEYNGTDNLIVAVDDNTGSYEEYGEYCIFTTYSTNAYRAIYNYNDNTNYDPATINGNSKDRLESNSQIVFTKEEGASPTLSVGSDTSGLTYEVDEGPSQVQAFTIVGCADEDITINVSDNFEISNSPNGTFSNTLTIPVTSKGNRDAIKWSFEGSFEGWTTIDADGDGHNWTLGSEFIPELSMVGYNGYDMLISESYYQNGNDNAVLNPDNWLISPQVTLGGQFTMYAMALDANYAAEHFGIYVSTTSNTNTSSFTLLNEWTMMAKGSGDKGGTPRSGNREIGSWYKFSVDLSDFAEQTGYIAVRHFNCSDQFRLLVDEFTLDVNPEEPGIVIDPNPVTVTAANVYIRLKSGLEAGFYSGTLTASVGETATNFSLSGEVFLPTYSTDIAGYGESSGGWYLIASPLKGETEVTSVGNLTSNSFDLYRFNPNSDREWENYKNEEHPDFTSLASGKGYLYANSDTVVLTFIGMPYAGEGNVTITNTEGHRLSGWNLIGNPWFTTANIGEKDFLRMNDDHDEIIPAEDSDIAPMEGIFVHTDADEETVTFSTSSKMGSTSERIIMNLSRNHGNVIDRAIVRLGEGRNLPKLQIKGNSTKLYIPKGNHEFAVALSDGQDEMPINFKASVNESYTIAVSLDNVEMSYLHLIDNLTGIDVDLLATPTYTFEGRTDDYASRFKLVFSAQDNNAEAGDDFAFISNGEIIVNGTGTLQVIDMLGRIIVTRDVETSYYGISTTGMTPGVYMLRLIKGDDVKTQKTVIR